MDKDVLHEIRVKKKGRKPSINYMREHYVFIRLYDYEVKKKVFELYKVEGYLFDVLMFSFLCASLSEHNYFTATMVYKLLPRKHNTNVNRNLNRLVEVGFLDRVRSKGWGTAARYTCNGSTLRLLKFYSYTMNKVIQNKDLSYVIE